MHYSFAPMSSADSPDSPLRRIMQDRRDKVAALRHAGRNPYRNDFHPTHTCAETRARYEGTKPEELGSKTAGIVPIDGQVIRIAGRVMARRGFGKTVFAPVRDATGDLQLFINVDHLDASDFNEVAGPLDVGDFVGAEGVAFWTKRGELSLLCQRLELLTKSLRPLPDKWSGLTDVETRYRQRYLDLAVSNEVRDVFRKRSQIVAGIRRFFEARYFLEVETPMMHPIIGGAAARPFVTHHNALDMQLYMRIAPELYLKRLLVGGLDRVFEINRNFRNEGLSRRHNPEFTMLEFYMAYATYETLMELTEELVVGLAQEVNGTTKTTWDGTELELAAPWKRLSVRQAVVELGGVSAAVFDDPLAAAEAAAGVGVSRQAIVRALLEPLSVEAASGLGGAEQILAASADRQNAASMAAKLVARYDDPLEARVRAGQIAFMIFEARCEDKLVQPTFLTDFPLAVSPLARKKEADPALVDRFELFVLGREIANAFSELNDPDDQRARFVAQLRARETGADETMDYDEDYCRALEVGMPPAAGEGVGIDRLTMLLTGQASIRDVILFPQMRPE